MVTNNASNGGEKERRKWQPEVQIHRSISISNQQNPNQHHHLPLDGVLLGGMVGSLLGERDGFILGLGAGLEVGCDEIYK